MRRQKKQMAAGFLILLAVCLFFGTAAGTRMGVAWAANSRVCDQAGLLSGDEAERLEEQYDEIAGKIGMDLVFVSADVVDGKTTQEYADDFYDENGYGLGDDASGALLLIDMENREVWISTAGDMIDYLTDARIESTLDAVIEGMDSGFYQAGVDFAESVEEYVASGYEENAHRYDSETGEITRPAESKGSRAAKSLLCALAFGILVCAVHYAWIIRKYRKYGETSERDYIGTSRAQFDVSEDQIVNRFVTRRHLPPPPPRTGGPGGGSMGRSTTHSSSSGSSHGGGGRGF